MRKRGSSEALMYFNIGCIQQLYHRLLLFTKQDGRRVQKIDNAYDCDKILPNLNNPSLYGGEKGSDDFLAIGNIRISRGLIWKKKVFRKR